MKYGTLRNSIHALKYYILNKSITDEKELPVKIQREGRLAKIKRVINCNQLLVVRMGFGTSRCCLLAIIALNIHALRMPLCRLKTAAACSLNKTSM
ncbi:hypothetical protein CEXT_21031 [Caerostris extrusa]|uniref:Uncharacterized protein n=1 Tax=Caerostris extrusa TaxID=172846 RepID=A0AAV4QPK7_CAEEX|nr:hypothetical protein CEXT_21031 [Caerostris extrusa]